MWVKFYSIFSLCRSCFRSESTGGHEKASDGAKEYWKSAEVRGMAPSPPASHVPNFRATFYDVGKETNHYCPSVFGYIYM